MSGAPTLAHVAATAGVSPATVSRVLTGSAPVSPAVQGRVQAAIEQLGYVRRRAPHRASGPSHAGAIALVVCKASSRFFNEPFFAQLVAGVERQLSGSGRPLLVLSGAPGALDSTSRYVAGGNVAGVLLVGAGSRHPFTATLPAAGIPVRCVGQPSATCRTPFVDVDNQGGARLAARRLLLAGRRQPATIAGPRRLAAARDRLRGFTTALAEAGGEAPTAFGDFSVASGAQGMSWLLHHAPRTDAVFVACDAMAVGALRALRDAGRRVPDDVAVIGFDDAPVAVQTRPRLTTVRQPIEELGARATRLLVATLNGSGHGSLGNPVLPTALVVRDSG